MAWEYKIAQIIKQQGKTSGDTVGFFVGTVESLTPLKIRFGSGFLLQPESLILSDLFAKRLAGDIMVDDRVLLEKVNVGDRVLLVGRQTFFVIDKEGG